MEKIFFFQLYILQVFFKEIFSEYAYFDFKFICVDNYLNYINSSEGIIKTTSPYKQCDYPISYIYDFVKIKHYLDKKFCIYFFNCWGPGNFAFEYASINEYIITIVDYENWYSCDDCNYIDTNKKFMTSTNICINNNPLIEYSFAGYIVHFAWSQGMI